MLTRVLLFFLALLSPMAVLADDHIVLPPVATASGPVKMMVFIPGGNVPNERYVATATSIQQELASTAALWVVIPAVTKRKCILECTSTAICSPLHNSVEAALSKATSRGWVRKNDKTDTFLAGHSLGGVCANKLLGAYEAPYAALVVMGSYVDQTGPYSLTNYSIPVLTLNVELDGGEARPGKTSIWWRQYLDLNQSQPESALLDKPVIVLPGLNHSDFCPGFDVPGDLMAEVTQADATKTIAQYVASYLATQIMRSSPPVDAVEKLRQGVTWTSSLLTPYIRAEGLTVDRTNLENGGEGSSQLCEMAQHTIANLLTKDDSRMLVDDAFHTSSANLEHCHPNYTKTNDGKMLVRTCSHTDYYADLDNTGSIEAPKELACKLLSPDRVAQQLNVTADPYVDCKRVNEEVVQIAKDMAHPHSLKRYMDKGKKICLLPDAPTFDNIGPVWVFKDALSMSENATCLAVQSPVLYSSISSKIYPGNMYCKVLAPERVLDWIMTDSLKGAH